MPVRGLLQEVVAGAALGHGPHWESEGMGLGCFPGFQHMQRTEVPFTAGRSSGQGRVTLADHV